MKFKKRNKEAKQEIIYSGFISRALAALLDCLIIGFFLWPLFVLVEKVLFGGILPSDVLNNIAMEYQSQIYEIGANSKNFPELIKKTFYLIIETPRFKAYFYEEHGYIKIIINNLVQIFSFLAIVFVFLHKKQSTPGMMLIGIKIVNANDLSAPSAKKLLIRSFALIFALVPFLLGIIWIVFDSKKQGWHDKIASTLIIKNN